MANAFFKNLPQKIPHFEKVEQKPPRLGALVMGNHRTLSPVLILMFSDFTWRRIGREKFPLSLNIIAQTLELELD